MIKHLPFHEIYFLTLVFLISLFLWSGISNLRWKQTQILSTFAIPAKVILDHSASTTFIRSLTIKRGSTYQQIRNVNVSSVLPVYAVNITACALAQSIYNWNLNSESKKKSSLSSQKIVAGSEIIRPFENS